MLSLKDLSYDSHEGFFKNDSFRCSLFVTKQLWKYTQLSILRLLHCLECYGVIPHFSHWCDPVVAEIYEFDYFNKMLKYYCFENLASCLVCYQNKIRWHTPSNV